jgi:hypothetical protein
MKRFKTPLKVLLLILIFSLGNGMIKTEVWGASLSLDIVDIATAVDVGPQDGVFDQIVPTGSGPVNNNGFTSLRTAFEFDLPASFNNVLITNATLVFRSVNLIQGTRQIAVYNYAGNGTVELPDFSAGSFVGNQTVNASDSGSFFSFDVTSFVQNLIDSQSPYAGFTIREEPPNLANLTVMFFFGTGAGQSPQLIIEFVTTPNLSITPTADSFLQAGGNKNFNEGANHVLVVEKKGTKRAVVDFDLFAITTQVVSSARLVFNLERPTQDWGTTGGTVDAHRLTAPFTEGNGFIWDQTLGLGDRGTGAGVTWNCATDTDISNKKTDCDQRWKGGSQASESVTNSAAITDAQTGEVSWDMTVDVQAALAEPTTTIQWLIRKTLEHGMGQAVFYSKEGAADMGDVTKAPRLVLEFVN